MWAKLMYFLLESKSQIGKRKGLGRAVCWLEHRLGRSMKPLEHKEYQECLSQRGEGGVEGNSPRSPRVTWPST